MAFQSVPETASVQIVYDFQGNRMQNQLHFRYAGGYTQTDIDNLAALVDFAVDADMLPLVSPAVDYINTEVKGLELITDLFAIEAANAGPGQATGTVTLPPNVTFAVRFTSGLTGRSSRGRLYTIGMMNAALQDPSHVTSVYAGSWVVALQNLRSSAGGIGWQMVIVSRYTSGAQRPTGVTFPITDVGYHDLDVDSQRNRLKND